MADDSLAAALEEIRERDKEVWDYRDRMGALEAIEAAKDDVPRLLAALDEVLNLTAGAGEVRYYSGYETGGLLVGWRLDPAAVRAAITRALLGEEAGDG